MQHGSVFGVVRIGGMGLAKLGRPGLSAARKKELWDRWKAGESISDIARALEKPPGSIHGVLKVTGGIAPPQRRRPRGGLSPAERGGDSPGLAAGGAMRGISGGVGPGGPARRAGGDLSGTRSRRVYARYCGWLGPGCLDRKPGSTA